MDAVTNTPRRALNPFTLQAMSEGAALLRDLKQWGRMTAGGISVIDEYVNRGKVNAGVGWAIVVGLMLVAWSVMIVSPEHWKIAGMFAATSCATSAYAAVLHLRCYAVRIAGLVRAMSSVQHEDGPAPLRRM